MKLLTDTAWFAALKGWRRRRRHGDDAADMGTAFGLDSITVIDHESQLDVDAAADRPARGDWRRRVTRRSRL